MALQIAPFIAIGTTQNVAVGGAAGATTLTFGVGTTGLPLTAARFAVVASAAAAPVFVQFIGTANTVTVGVTNAQCLLVNQVAVLGTGGQAAVALNTSGTSTCTVFVTGGIGYAGS